MMAKKSAKKCAVRSELSVYEMRAMQSIEESLKKEKHHKIENSNTENITWTLTVVNKCLTLKQRLTPSPKMSA